MPGAELCIQAPPLKSNAEIKHSRWQPSHHTNDARLACAARSGPGSKPMTWQTHKYDTVT